MGFTEILIIGVVALLVIGPKQLPEVARTVGRLINELKRATGDIGSTLRDTTTEAKESFNEAKEMVDPQKLIEDLEREVEQNNKKKEDEGGGHGGA